MNESAVTTLLEEFKNGLSNIKDFYGNEWFMYYSSKNEIAMFVGVLMMIIGIIWFIIWRSKEEDRWIPLGAFGTIGFVVVLIGGIRQYLLYSSPKVYLTKRIVEMITGLQ